MPEPLNAKFTTSVMNSERFDQISEHETHPQ